MNISLEAKQVEWADPRQPQDQADMTVVGGCNGILVVPGSGLADYYKAHAYAALIATALLAIAVLMGLVS
jgi:hypothetical protein